MATGAEVRAWARATGREVPDSGRIGAALRGDYEAAHADPGPGPDLEDFPPNPLEILERGGPESNGEPAVQLPSPLADVAPASGRADERAPAGAKSGGPLDRARRRLWSVGGDGQAAAAKDKPAKAPRPARKRVSLETLGSLAWVGAARLVMAAGGDDFTPVQRMMMFEAPVAGLVVEDAARGTVADRVVQPIARLTEGGSDIGALVGVPLLTAILCKRPELYPQIKPMLLGLMRQWVITAGPQMRKLRQREEKFAAELGEMIGEFGPGFTLEGMLEAAFADSPAGFNQAEEEAIRRARAAGEG